MENGVLAQREVESVAFGVSGLEGVVYGFLFSDSEVGLPLGGTWKVSPR
jgi:hypothetical protein